MNCNSFIYPCPSWVQCGGGKTLNIILLRISKFCKNWHREGHTLLIGVNKIACAHV